jgi:hypothetical protein
MLTYKFRVSAEIVGNWIPHGVKVWGSADVREIFIVTATVTSVVELSNTRHSVERLVDVSNIMDHKAKSKRLSVFKVGEIFNNLFIVCWVRVVSSVHEPHGENGQGVRDVFTIHLEVGEVFKVPALHQVGLVNEVPVWLELVFALNLVSKVSTLCEGVLVLTFRNVWEWSLQHSKLIDGVLKGLRCFSFENALGCLWDYEKRVL